jgi:glycosyltransferase involved in cell wall biosynthesis
MLPSRKSKESRLKLSVVMPIWNEEEILPELKRLLDQVAAALPHINFEFVFADDGSHDATLTILKAFLEQDERVVIVRLSRNFGHQPCLMAGLQQATGEAVVLLDGDLEDPPEVIPALLKAWESGDRVVIAIRRKREAPLVRKALFNLFHRLLQLLSDFPIVPDAGTFCLLDKRACRALLSMPESHRFLPGLRSWVGFQVGLVSYDREARFAGEPKQSIRRLVRYAFDAVFGFSYKPLRISLYFGTVTWLISILYASALVVQRLMGIDVVKGFTTTTVLVLLFGGGILVSLGILGEYIGRIYDEVKRRPLSVVDEVLRFRHE